MGTLAISTDSYQSPCEQEFYKIDVTHTFGKKESSPSIIWLRMAKQKCEYFLKKLSDVSDRGLDSEGRVIYNDDYEFSIPEGVPSGKYSSGII